MSRKVKLKAASLLLTTTNLRNGKQIKRLQNVGNILPIKLSINGDWYEKLSYLFPNIPDWNLSRGKCCPEVMIEAT